jgi:dTDP-4-dehydrorhamnose 3,5-epimerase
MVFEETKIPGTFIIEPERLRDERGYFARVFCAEAFTAHGLNPDVSQCSTSMSTRARTLRGMHYQASPHAEAKLVRCNSGAIYDVVVDLRPESPTYAQWAAAELSAENGKMVYVPEGVAHGYQTLVDNCEVFYQMTVAYHAESAAGVRWNDPAFAIDWPFPDGAILNARDASYPDFERQA